MRDQTSQQRFKPGDVVHSKKDPVTKLIVRRFYGQVYYCKLASDPERKELVYFDRELG